MLFCLIGEQEFIVQTNTVMLFIIQILVTVWSNNHGEKEAVT